MGRIFSFVAALFFISIGAQAAAKEAKLILQIRGDSGSSVASINKKLKAKGARKLLPSEIELSSKMGFDDIRKIEKDLNDLLQSVSPNERIETSAYGDKINGKDSCFKGDNTKVADIYSNMTDIFLSDQFTIMAKAVKDPDHVGIKFDQTDSGSEGTWINISRCE